jgi:Family of unknown function (DUF5519)
MTETPTASQQITDEVSTWPGIEGGPGRRGEFALKLAGTEIGHLHGDHSAHFFFPTDVWEELKTQNRIVPHPVFPHKRGPAARKIDRDEDIRDVIEMMRLNYDRVARAAARGSDDKAVLAHESGSYR